jgi:hypothetical protein
MTDWFEEKVLRAILNDEAFPDFTDLYLGLALGTAFADDASSPYTNEAVGAGYNRKSVSGDFTIAAAAGAWTGKNTDPIPFDEATSDYSDQIVGWGLFDASTGGNLAIHGTCTAKTVVEGNVPWIDALDLTVEAK